MNDRYKDDKDLREIMQGMTEVPFRTELRSRILEEAQEERRMRGGSLKSRRKRIWANYASVAAGLVAVVVVGIFGLHLTTHQVTNETTATSPPIPFRANAKEFGLDKAPVQLADLRIGTADGDPVNSDVLVNVKNVSKHAISESDLFGVLSFSPKGQKAAQENWITFVNGPSGTIAPGQTAVWHFHPTGSQLYGPEGEHIVETPHLSFFTSQLVNPKKANVIWKTSDVKVSNIQSEPRDLGNGMQSVQVNAQLTNTSSKPINLSQSRAVIWFAADPTQSFLSDNSIRFMYHMTPEYAGQSWPNIIQPGQTINVNFPVISNAKSDFFSRTPHVIVIDAASLIQ